MISIRHLIARARSVMDRLRAPQQIRIEEDNVPHLDPRWPYGAQDGIQHPEFDDE